MQPQIDPITGMPVVAAQPAQQMTNMPPQQANAMGASQPVFSPRATQAGTGLFGDMQQRQNSVNAPLMFKKKHEDMHKKIGMTQLPEITINGSKGNDKKFGSAAPGKGSKAHGDSKYEKATYQLMDEGSIDETSDANYGKILDRMQKNEDAERYNNIEDGSAGNLSKIAGASPFNQENVRLEVKQQERVFPQSFKELPNNQQIAEPLITPRPIIRAPEDIQTKMVPYPKDSQEPFDFTHKYPSISKQEPFMPLDREIMQKVREYRPRTNQLLLPSIRYKSNPIIPRNKIKTIKKQ